VLFVQRLGGTPFQAGLAYAFMYLFTPVQVLATVLLPVHGYKRLALGGWGIRSFSLLIPVGLALLRPDSPSPWSVAALVASVGFFCLFRSIGLAAMTSWWYRLIPPEIRGRYYTQEQFLAGLSSAGTQLLAAGLFLFLPFYPAVCLLYLVAMVGSLVSYFALQRLPDAPYDEAIDLRAIVRDTPRHLWARRDFSRYLWFTVGWMILLTPIPPFAAYYLKSVEQLPSDRIMALEFVRFLSMGLAAWGFGRLVGVRGTRILFPLALGALGLVAVYWLFRLHGHGLGLAGLISAYALLGLANVSWVIASADYVPRVVAGDQSALLVAIYGAMTAFVGGIAPVVWGPLLNQSAGGGRPAGFSPLVFTAFFVFVAAAAAGLALVRTRCLQPVGRPSRP
jgi:hypothetical protein